MNKLTNKQHVELFHLLFIEQLSQKLDKRLYAVKGGCNLRFFLGSIRFKWDRLYQWTEQVLNKSRRTLILSCIADLRAGTNSN
jgi:hypothetical protein